MSESGAIEPTRVYRPPVSSSTRAPATTGRQRFYSTYNTRYVYNDDPVGGIGPAPAGSGAAPRSGPVKDIWESDHSGAAVYVPKGLPKFLGGRSMLFFAWMAAMAMVSVDEWHTNHILPRPARLWYTSLLFFILGAVSMVDVLVPFTNMFAVGMVIVLGMQYYSGTGQFGTAAVAPTDTSVQAGGVNYPIPGTGTLSVDPASIPEQTFIATQGAPGAP